MNDIVKQLVDSSRTYQRTGEALLERAHVQYNDGKIAYSEYNTAVGLHSNLMLAAQGLNNAAMHLIITDLSGDLVKITEATKKLEKVSSTIVMVGNVIGIVGKLVVAVAAVTAAVANPVAIPAAVAALEVVVSEIQKQVADKV
jgi:hypothetical protein